MSARKVLVAAVVVALVALAALSKADEAPAAAAAAAAVSAGDSTETSYAGDSCGGGGKRKLAPADGNPPPAAPKAEPAAEAVVDPDVVVLDDYNFEKLTQATTGSTTGPWFIEFYAPWCGHCKKLAPLWGELATRLKGRVNVAKVDATKPGSAGTAKRFELHGYPTLYLVKDGKAYEFKGKRTMDELTAFAEGDLGDSEPTEIKAPPTLWETIEFEFKSLADITKRVHEFNPGYLYTFGGVCALAGFLLGFLFTMIVLEWTLPRGAAKPAAVNGAEKAKIE